MLINASHKSLDKILKKVHAILALTISISLSDFASEILVNHHLRAQTSEFVWKLQYIVSTVNNNIARPCKLRNLFDFHSKCQGNLLRKQSRNWRKKMKSIVIEAHPSAYCVRLKSAGVPLISVIITCRIGVNIPFDLKYFKWKLLPCLCKLHFWKRNKRQAARLIISPLLLYTGLKISLTFIVTDRLTLIFK